MSRISRCVNNLADLERRPPRLKAKIFTKETPRPDDPRSRPMSGSAGVRGRSPNCRGGSSGTAPELGQDRLDTSAILIYDPNGKKYCVP